ncbi:MULTISPECIES: hypothetical protein [Larsenimonas]|uniref:Uncharacterized protein n=1 Tax=Larsenimonas suaedae TaxID=1851019 RepID=A0ABU1GT53_9GAMM|nr:MULTISPECIES: hypothetical protein [Larsenimonas]MCM2971648.1 hypothetical protein [Larsenimonas suaedae]MCM5703753.1 hypothetical protein [Larsenimonas salina]MDR5895200.1 hypothetical protein [Larsenimonas suaedae]
MSDLFNSYQQWKRFNRQDKLDREHQAAMKKVLASGAMARKMVEAFKSMAEKGAAQGACYRTIYQHQSREGEALTREGWLFVRRVHAEGGSTRVRATLLDAFTLEDGEIEFKAEQGKGITLEIFDEISTRGSISMSCRVDRTDDPRDTQFITFLDMVRGDLKNYL